MRFVYKNLTEKYIRVLKEEHSEKDSLVRIINDMSLSQEEMYATLLKELIRPETEEDFLLSVDNLRDAARTSYGAHARAFNFRILVSDAEKLGYPKLAYAADAALTFLHQEKMYKMYRNTQDPELVFLRRDQFKAAFAQSQDEKRAREAQRQHTSTHGVDLSNLEEMFDHEPWPDDLFERANNAIFDAIIDWNEEENILPKRVKDYTDTIELFNDLSKGILNKYKNKLNNTAITSQVFVAEIMGRQLKKHLPKGFSKDDIDTWLGSALGDYAWGSWDIQTAIDGTEWLGDRTIRQAAIDAQRQHTKTHGVDLTDL